jgi:D-glycero-D-manno-heptose 1,7-bisphosphate phosphatase
MTKRAVFLDRDGTINVDVGYPRSYDQIEIYPYSYDAVGKIQAAGFLAVITTNQSGIGRGLLTEDELREIHRKMAAAFASRGIRLDGIYYCPHYDRSDIPAFRQNCACRKPGTGMALRAAEDLGIDLSRSYVIGDKVEDVLFGLNIGAKPVLVRTGFGRAAEQSLREKGFRPAAVAENLLEAVDWILQCAPAEHDPV